MCKGGVEVFLCMLCVPVNVPTADLHKFEAGTLNHVMCDAEVMCVRFNTAPL